MAPSKDLATVKLSHNENVTVEKEGMFFGFHHFTGVELKKAVPTTLRCKVVKILGEKKNNSEQSFMVEKRFKGAKRTKICKNWILVTIRVNIREPISKVFYQVTGCMVEVDGEQGMLPVLPGGCSWMLEFRHMDKHDKLSYFVLSQVGMARVRHRYLVFFRDGDPRRNNKETIIVNSNKQTVDAPKSTKLKKKGTKK